MSNVIQLRRSTTPSNAPSSLASGEVAVNEADQKLFYRRSSDNSVQSLDLTLASKTVSGAGLATGGGAIGTNPTVTVTASSNARAVAGTDTSTAMTPAATKAAINALRAPEMNANFGGI